MKFHNKIFYQIKHIPAMLGLTALTATGCGGDKPMVIEKDPEIITQHDTIYTSRNDTIYTPHNDTIYVLQTDTINAGRIDTTNIKQRDVMLFLKSVTGTESLEPTIKTLQEYANCDTVSNIYLVPSPDFDWKQGSILPAGITQTRKQLQEKINVSPKIHGRGNFDFIPGRASMVPEDSLWFVQNGWTINKQK